MITEKDLLELINIQMRARGFATVSKEAVESVDFAFDIFCKSNNLSSTYNEDNQNFYLRPDYGWCPTCDN